MSGGAFGESVDVTLLDLVNVDSGPVPSVTLPSTGGTVSDSLLTVTVPPGTGTTLEAGLLEVASQGETGETGFVESSASVADVDALNGILTATLIESTCRSDSSGSTGSTTLAGATLNLPGADPLVLAAEPAPNTTIPLPGIGEIILNEQVESEQPFDSSITVNAVHIVLDGLLGTGDIIISQSRCGVQGPNVNTTTTVAHTTTTVAHTTTTVAPTTTTVAPTTTTVAHTTTTVAHTTTTVAHTTTTVAHTTTTKVKAKCNAGRGNGSEPPHPPAECDPGNSPGRNKGGD